MAQIVRLCTWNIQLGAERETILKALERYPDFAGLDLLALQEASIHDHTDDARAIAAVLGPTYDRYQVTAHRLNGREQANALVWNSDRVRVRSEDHMRLPYARETKLSRAENTILRALSPQQRISLVLEADIGATTARIYVAHLDVLGYAHKREQFMHLLNDASTRDQVDLTVLAGDFNTFKIRSRPSWSQLSAAAQDLGYLDLTSEIRWTHALRTLHLKQKLDAIFVRHAQPLEYRSWSLDIPGSDHIPVFADLILPKKPGVISVGR